MYDLLNCISGSLVVLSETFMTLRGDAVCRVSMVIPLQRLPSHIHCQEMALRALPDMLVYSMLNTMKDENNFSML